MTSTGSRALNVIQKGRIQRTKRYGHIYLVRRFRGEKLKEIGMEALKDIIQCNKMVKVSCILKGVIRSVKADQGFFKGITAGHF